MGWITIIYDNVAKMKVTISIIISMFTLLTFSACEKEEPRDNSLSETETKPSTDEPSANLPEGYFEVNFSPEYGDNTRAAVAGSDGRIRHLRYIIYNSNGNYVKEKVVLKASDATPIWPLAAIKDTLPKGNYTVVFLANIEKTMFPYDVSSSETAYQDVLLSYQGNMTDARIALPNAPFTDTSEYYWAKVNFSDTSSQPYVLLQRIISMLNLHRNFIDAQTALNKLVSNIVTQMNYKNILQTNVSNILPGLLKTKLTGVIIIGLDGVVNSIASTLLVPVTNALYDILLQKLVDQIGMALTGNTNQQGTLAFLGVILNSWAQNEASTALVTIRDFPRTMDFNLTVKDLYAGDHIFRSELTQGGIQNEKDVLIKGFNGPFNIRKIDILKKGLISGFLIDRTVDSSLLLNGDIDDINDPLSALVATNKRYKADYSFVDLKLKSYTEQTDGPHKLGLTVELGNVANIDNILNIPLLKPVLDLILAPVKTIKLETSVNLPLLGIDNLTVSGSWSAVTPY